MIELIFQTYWCLLGLVLAFVVARGGEPEQHVIVALAAASLLTAVSTPYGVHTYGTINWRIFSIDAVAALYFVHVALRANRRWPLKAAAFQLLGAIGHVAKEIAPIISPATYSWMTAIWAWLIILLVATATWRHDQRLRTSGVDQSWLPSSSPSSARTQAHVPPAF